MSARAASRLEALEFQKVYRYQPGKADWFAAGLAREGKAAHTQRVADIAERNVPTCSIGDSVTAVLERVRAAGGDVGVVIDPNRVVLGLVRLETLEVNAPTSVEEVMQPSPLTFRPNLEVGKLPEYAKTQRLERALVTTSDGALIGLLRF